MGDVEARATWLRGRVQEGALWGSRVELLAFIGDPAAGVACDRGAGPDPVESPSEFFSALVEFDAEAAYRLALHCAAPLVEALTRHAEWEQRPKEAWEAGWSWLETEDLAERETARVTAAQAADDAEDAVDELMDRQLEGLSIELGLVAGGVVAAVRMGTELREEALPALGRETLSELEAGFAELGLLEPVEGSCLSAGLENLQAWCLMTR